QQGAVAEELADGQAAAATHHQPADHRQYQRPGNAPRDHATLAALVPDGDIEQDRLEDFAIHDDEDQAQQENPGGLAQRMPELVAYITLPVLGMSLPMHPYADPDQDDRGKQGAKAFGKLTACATDGDDPCGQSP